jgi:hypothetical protein
MKNETGGTNKQFGVETGAFFFLFFFSLLSPHFVLRLCFFLSLSAILLSYTPNAPPSLTMFIYVCLCLLGIRRYIPGSLLLFSALSLSSSAFVPDRN